MNATRKWILHRVSAVILAPLFVWFYFSLISLSEKNYQEAIYFFENPLFKILTVALFFIGFFHAKITALILCNIHFFVSFIKSILLQITKI